ncbi:Undecaprenyl pyrophosphate synthase [Capnocytophaga ochracea]|jgi:di-trans,poly-cis-decaprenylcistransferase|uniref:Isoprenyl transferase n=1 Tax=Capnocytophaga ochracea TaxID=1018 RepID=A0A2X2RPS9_CAPOC|nr:isoprenyl transferase [Capnocytophaga ochracea]SQA78633.1 Undecaprenyl pyrophosphate synthase [Capnocytophaga ochracea]
MEITNYPKHLAIIMDGNGRWAKKQGLLRAYGHEKGVQTVRQVVEYCVEHRIPYLTLFAFSTENWKRPALEVKALMELLVKFLKKEVDNLHKNNVRLKTIGNLDRFPPKPREALLASIDKLKNNTGLTLTLALNYGAREEILTAIKEIAAKVKEGTLIANTITETTLQKHLYTYDLPDVDLLIRTSGEERISNFLLWQIAYAELYFTEVLWPDFTKKHLEEALLNYQNRERRFGKTSEQLT